jgi:hypothetical protein
MGRTKLNNVYALTLIFYGYSEDEELDYQFVVLPISIIV